MPFKNDLRDDLGLFSERFGELSTLAEWHAATKSDSAYPIATVPLAELLDLFNHTAGAQLSITLPCIGFVDLLFSFDTRQGFALPLSIDGFVSLTQPIAAKVIAKDILGNLIELDPQAGNYLSQLQNHQAEKVFSTLSELEYIFDSNQLHTLGVATDMAQLKGHIQFALPAAMSPDYPIGLSVSDSDGQLLKKVIADITDYTQPSTPHFNLMANTENGEDFISYRAELNQDPLAVQRASISVQVQDHDAPKTFTQYLGLSDATFKQVVSTILKPDSSLLAQKQYSIDEHINDFSVPGSFEAFKTHLLDGVISKTVPLVGIASWLDLDNLGQNLQAMPMDGLDQHDAAVWSEFLNNIQQADDAFDSLDALFMPLYSTLDGEIPLSHTLLEGDKLSASLHIEYHDQALDLPASQSDFSFAADSHESMLHLDAMALEYIGGKTFEITFYQALKHADVIEDFSVSRHDKLDLSGLLDNLNATSSKSPSVEARSTETGDTQIWVTHYPSDTDMPEQLHVATLVGVSAEQGNLSDDLSSYIDGGGLL